MLRKRILFVMFLGILVLANGSTVARSQAPPGGYTIGIEVNADGSWRVAEIFGIPTNLTPETFNSLAGLFGMRITLPTAILPQQTVDFLKQAGITQLTLAMDGPTTRVWVDERFLPEIELNSQALKAFVGESGGFLMDILTLVRGSAYVRLPSDKVVSPDLSQTIRQAAVHEGAIANKVQLEATLRPTGQWLSAGGFTREDAVAAGLLLPLDVDPRFSAFLAGYDKIQVDITPNELVLMTDNEPAIRLIWDRDSRQALIETVEDLARIRLDSRVLTTIEGWLAKSRVSLALHIANEPRDGAPVVEIGTPIAVALNDTDVPTIEGIPLYGLMPQVTDAIRQTAAFTGIAQIQTCWSGDSLRWLVNGMPMPYVTVSEGWLSQAIRLAGFEPLPAAGKIEQALANVVLPVSLSVGATPTAAAGDCAYEAATATAPFAVNVKASWNRQSDQLALEKLDLPILMPLDVAAQIHLPGVSAFVPAGLTRIAAHAGPSGFSAKINDVDASLHWDPALLNNLARVVDRLGPGYGGYILQAAQLVGTTEINVVIESREMVTSSPEAKLDETTLERAGLTPVAVVAELPATVTQARGTAEPPVAQQEAVLESQVTTGESTEQKVTLEETAAPSANVCVVPEGGTLWACWLQLGGSRGTGMPWTEWSLAIVKAYGLKFDPEDLVIVQPGMTIASSPSQ